MTHCRLANCFPHSATAWHSKRRPVHKTLGGDTCADERWQGDGVIGVDIAACTVQSCRTQLFAERRHACAHQDTTAHPRDELHFPSLGYLAGMLASRNHTRKVAQLGTCFNTSSSRGIRISEAGPRQIVVHVLCREPAQSICSYCHRVNAV